MTDKAQSLDGTMLLLDQPGVEMVGEIRFDLNAPFLVREVNISVVPTSLPRLRVGIMHHWYIITMGDDGVLRDAFIMQEALEGKPLKPTDQDHFPRRHGIGLKRILLLLLVVASHVDIFHYYSKCGSSITYKTRHYTHHHLPFHNHQGCEDQPSSIDRAGPWSEMLLRF